MSMCFDSWSGRWGPKLNEGEQLLLHLQEVELWRRQQQRRQVLRRHWGQCLLQLRRQLTTLERRPRRQLQQRLRILQMRRLKLGPPVKRRLWLWRRLQRLVLLLRQDRRGST